MGERERVHFGLVTITIAWGWVRDASFLDVRRKHDDTSAPPSSRTKHFVLASPRSDGRFHLDTIAMPSDMGAFDCERLRSLVEQRNQTPITSMLYGNRFDHQEWSKDGVACIGYSVIWKAGPALQDPSTSPVDADPADLMQLTTTRVPSIQRDWYLARGTDMANVWYRCSNADEAAADIADCEDMIRSIVFER